MKDEDEAARMDVLGRKESRAKFDTTLHTINTLTSQEEWIPRRF